MLRKLRLTCALAALAASTLVPPFASAQTESKGKSSQSYSAWAYFWDEDPVLCNQRETVVEVVERWVKPDSGPMEHLVQLNFRSIYYDETCPDWPVSVIIFSTAIPVKSFTSRGLKSASLKTLIHARDGDRGIVSIAIDLVWTGGLYSDGKHSQGFSGATVSGSLLIGSTNLLISSDSIYGELAAYRNGSVY